MVLLNHFLRNLSLFIFTFTPAFAGVLSFFNPNKFTTPKNNFYLKIQSFYANDAVSLQTRLHKMKGPINTRNGDNLELIDTRLDVGLHNKYIGYIGYTSRLESLKITSKDMEELYHSVRNKKSLETGRKYKLKLLLDTFKADGIVLANKYNAYNRSNLTIELGVAIELLRANIMQHWKLQGNAEAIGKKDYNYDVISKNNYTRNYLYKLKVPKSNAIGYSSHISIKINYNNFKFLLLANDIFGKLYWKNLPYSYVKIHTDNKTYNKKGYVKYNPSVSGIEKEFNYTQKLLQKFRLETGYLYKKSLFSIGSDYIDTNYLPYFSYKYYFNNNFSTKIEYETRFRSYYTEVQYKNILLGLRANTLKENKVLAFNLGLSF